MAGIFDYGDGIVTVTPALLTPTGQAVPAGPDFRIMTTEEVTFDPGGKSAYLKGMSATPIQIATATAEGKLELKLSNAMEGLDAVGVLGGIGSDCIVSIDFAKLGMPPVSILIAPAKLENGGQLNGSDTKAYGGALSFKFTDALVNGLSVYKLSNT